MAWRDIIQAFRGNPAVESVTFRDTYSAAVAGLTVEDLWRTQPYLRTVVTFLARNIAQLGLHSFERVSDTDRRRLRSGPVAQLFAQPNPNMTSYELVYSLVADLALYEEAIWWITDDMESPSGYAIQTIPPSWVVRQGGGNAFSPDWFEFQAPSDIRPTRVRADDVLRFHGWNPGVPSRGSSPVEALKQILAEQIAAQQFRQQLWARGGRIGAVLTRPAGAKWDAKTREKFQRQWAAKYAGNDGPGAGGTPILEDGMTLQRVGFSAHEEDFIEGAKLSLATVASVYHVNPTMVGLLDNANFSNVREFRKMLYGDTLGPLTAMIEDRINGFLVPRITTADNVYVEFNIAEKLQGNFEEQTAAMSSAVGRPWMTADEARALSNMPSLGGDAAALVTPLNVLVGGQSSPRDSGSQNVRSGAVSVKSRAPETFEQKTEQVLRRFFRRQRAVVLTALGAKADQDWWDQERWDRELSEDLYKLAVLATAEVGSGVAKSLGFDGDQYNTDQTLKFLEAVAISRAGMINATTRDRILKSLDTEDGNPAHVFDEAEDTRSGVAATALITTFSAFATTEAAKQVSGGRATKTWIVTSGNPRSSHAAMNGETVGIEDTFSNGAAWPGDPVLGADGVANCLCDVQIDIP